ncbi:MAG TPA: hypothetical protein DIT04_11275 [Dysgonomonas sp.]|nr:hypothetical protein [Dysgonomonas sp.]
MDQLSLREIKRTNEKVRMWQKAFEIEDTAFIFKEMFRMTAEGYKHQSLDIPVKSRNPEDHQIISRFFYECLNFPGYFEQNEDGNFYFSGTF